MSKVIQIYTSQRWTDVEAYPVDRAGGFFTGVARQCFLQQLRLYRSESFFPVRVITRKK